MNNVSINIFKMPTSGRYRPTLRLHAMIKLQNCTDFGFIFTKSNLAKSIYMLHTQSDVLTVVNFMRNA